MVYTRNCCLVFYYICNEYSKYYEAKVLTHQLCIRMGLLRRVIMYKYTICANTFNSKDAGYET